MKRAYLNLRHSEGSRVELFRKGLTRCGFEVIVGFPKEHTERDVLVTWNRIGYADEVARKFKGQVLVAENALWGNDFHGKRWLSIARKFHNTAETFPIGSVDRWDRLGVRLDEWRTGGETVVLPQRGIGPKEVAMPKGWTAPGRIRPHPGRNPSVPLRTDLTNCGKVVTWGSGSAIQALMWGIPVESHYPQWVGRQSNTDEDRLRMFRELAWCTWTHEEIADGGPFENLLRVTKYLLHG